MPAKRPDQPPQNSAINSTIVMSGRSDKPLTKSCVYALALRIDVVEHPVHRQFAQHDGVLNPQQGMALRAGQLPREVTQHDTR